MDWYSPRWLYDNGDVGIIEGVSSRPRGAILTLRSNGSLVAATQFPFSASPTNGCPLQTLSSSPLFVRCALGSRPWLFHVGRTPSTSWETELSGAANDVWSLSSAANGDEVVLATPTGSSDARATVLEYEISSHGAVIKHELSVIPVTNNGSGGDINASPDGHGGWLVLSNEWAGPTNRCYQLSRYTGSLRQEWTEFFGAGCYGSDTVDPVVAAGRIYLLMSGSENERVVSVPLAGGRAHVVSLATGSQLGLVMAPICFVQGNSLWVAGFTDGSLVEPPTTDPRVDYLYLARIRADNGVLTFRARTPNTLTSKGGGHFALYSPSEIVVTNDIIEVLAPRLEGDTTKGMPLALTIRTAVSAQSSR